MKSKLKQLRYHRNSAKRVNSLLEAITFDQTIGFSNCQVFLENQTFVPFHRYQNQLNLSSGRPSIKQLKLESKSQGKRTRLLTSTARFDARCQRKLKGHKNIYLTPRPLITEEIFFFFFGILEHFFGQFLSLSS